MSANNVWEEVHEYSRVFGLEDKKQNNFFLSLPVPDLDTSQEATSP